MQQRAEFADEGHEDGETGRPGHDCRVGVFGQHHRAGDFAVGRHRRAAEQADDADGQPVAQQRPVQTGRFGKVPARHRTDGQNAADVLDDGGDGDRNHEKNGGQIEFRPPEVRNGEPRRLPHRGKIDNAQVEGDGVTDGDADENRHQFEQTPRADHRQHRRQQRNGGDRERRAVGHDLRAARLARRHIDGDLR